MEKKRRHWVRWSKTKREAFLDHLAGTANVRASADVAGVTPPSVYHLRRKDEEFAEEWRKALALGYDMLETELLGHILAGGGRTIACADGREIDVQEAIRLLGLHRNSLKGKWKGGPPLKRARPEDTDAAIMRKLDAIDRARAREAAERAEKQDGQ
ncbi:hypothetical protein [Sphingomonas sp. NIBR02145]|uniref:hypothetical protein n=1 Tax=Sphingomonas sp. NIBR02145 TaxID=3014784 RepID=UPI0022B57A65|nr:hypothetical protein [Sphingomonas sp. NIBR02145]WHU01334.1 hypothetical protein O3305_14120 [Sphingomonas sp. NIBR02145]